MGWDDDYNYYSVPWTLIWSLTAVGIVLIIKGAFLIWYCCYYRPRRMQAMAAARQNQLTFAPSPYGYTVNTNQYGVATSTAGPMPDKNAAPPPPYSSAYNGGFNGGNEGGYAPYPQAGAPYPQAGAAYPQAGAAYPPADAMGGNMVNPPPYEGPTAPHQAPPK